MATRRTGSPSPIPNDSSVWLSTQRVAVNKRPGETISQAAAPQRTQVGAVEPGDEHGSATEGPKAYYSQKCSRQGDRQAGVTGPRAVEGLGAIRGINSSLCAYARPSKVVLLYVHNKVRAVMRAAAFSCMYARSRRTSGNSILKKKPDTIPCYLSNRWPERSWPRLSIRPALPGEGIKTAGWHFPRMLTTSSTTTKAPHVQQDG